MLQQATPKASFPAKPEDCHSLAELHQSLINESVEIVRKTIGLRSNNLPLPKLVTHRHYHLDEAWADLLFRAMHINHSQPEFIIELSQRDKELSYDLHPQILNAVLIGIGGEKEAEPNVVVFDEHTASGQRLAASVSHMLVEQLITKHTPSIDRIMPLIDEINYIDSKGDKAGGRLGLSALIKGLHWVNTYDPAQRYGLVLAGHKESVCLASLAALATAASEFTSQQPTLDALSESWGRYVAKAGWVFGSDEAVSDIAKDIYKSGSNPALTSLRNVAAAVDKHWPREIADYIVHTFFETLVQTQQDFLDWLDDDRCSERMTVEGCVLEWLVMSRTSKLTQRPRLYKLNRKRTAGLVLIHDPLYMTSALFRSNALEERTWDKLINLIQEAEPELWHKVIRPDEKIVRFILNGSRAHLEVPASKLMLQDIAEFLRKAMS
ncbi:MAG: hypothetical protein WD688_19330 [Candidatus Binatia bacterium]